MGWFAFLELSGRKKNAAEVVRLDLLVMPGHRGVTRCPGLPPVACEGIRETDSVAANFWSDVMRPT